MRVYIAGPYTADTPEKVERNIESARHALTELLKVGATPFCPHTHTANMEGVEGLSYQDFMRIGLEWLAQCEAMLLLTGWQSSRGTLIELEEAHRLRIPVYSELENVLSIVRIDKER